MSTNLEYEAWQCRLREYRLRIARCQTSALLGSMPDFRHRVRIGFILPKDQGGIFEVPP